MGFVMLTMVLTALWPLLAALLAGWSRISRLPGWLRSLLFGMEGEEGGERRRTDGFSPQAAPSLHCCRGWWAGGWRPHRLPSAAPDK